MRRRLRLVEGASGVSNLLDIVSILDHPLGHQEAGCKIEVAAWGSHGDRDRSRDPRIRRPIGELDLQRLFDRKIVQYLLRHRAGDPLDGHLPRGGNCGFRWCEHGGGIRCRNSSLHPYCSLSELDARSAASIHPFQQCVPGEIGWHATGAPVGRIDTPCC